MKWRVEMKLQRTALRKGYILACGLAMSLNLAQGGVEIKEVLAEWVRPELGR